ncbi:MAG TPA: hypothetical protein VKK31_15840 [Thermoanaerobaculia bacterium]|nr:hypothetical protein [Thermoanaerobaculia bacterium]
MIALILWLVGLLAGLDVIHVAHNVEFWSLVGAGLLLLLGSVLDGL